MTTGCITTWIAGDYTKGTARILYRIATRSTVHPGHLSFSTSDVAHSSAQGARRAARAKGVQCMPGVAQGWREARRWLGLEAGNDIEREPPHHSHKFLSAYPDSFAA